MDASSRTLFSDRPASLEQRRLSLEVARSSVCGVGRPEFSQLSCTALPCFSPSAQLTGPRRQNSVKTDAVGLADLAVSNLLVVAAVVAVAKLLQLIVRYSRSRNCGTGAAATQPGALPPEIKPLESHLNNTKTECVFEQAKQAQTINHTELLSELKSRFQRQLSESTDAHSLLEMAGGLGHCPFIENGRLRRSFSRVEPLGQPDLFRGFHRFEAKWYQLHLIGLPFCRDPARLAVSRAVSRSAELCHAHLLRCVTFWAESADRLALYEPNFSRRRINSEQIDQSDCEEDIIVEADDKCSLKSDGDANSVTLIVQMELGQGGWLTDALKRVALEEVDALVAFDAAVRAISHLHENGLAHRRVGLDALVLHQNEVKLSLVGAFEAVPLDGFRPKRLSLFAQSEDQAASLSDEDVQRDLAGLGSLLRQLLDSTGRINNSAEESAGCGKTPTEAGQLITLLSERNSRVRKAADILRCGPFVAWKSRLLRAFSEQN